MEYYNQRVEDIVATLKSNPTTGLVDGEIALRQKMYGPNELKAKKKINPVVLFLNQFKSFIIYILLFAIIISLLSKEFVDATVILVILLFNACFGFIQEYKAEKAIDALKKMSGLKAHVMRNGKSYIVDTKDIVPGDIIVLEEGNKIPADARIIDCTALQVSEASLTGESVPVEKNAGIITGEIPLADRKNMLFSGTTVSRGKAHAIVVATGMNTEIGKIAKMINDVEDEQTPLQKKLDVLGKWIGTATIGICAIIFIVEVIKKQLYVSLLDGKVVDFLFAVKENLITSVSLAVAAVPEGLPAIVTIALSIGVIKMVRRNALIRKLPSVETLGETTIICSDKTGTLTCNEMTVVHAYTFGKIIDVSGNGYALDGTVAINGKPITKDGQLLFKIGALCNDASIIVGASATDKNTIVGDPTEAALLISAHKAGIAYKEVQTASPRVDELPFDSIRKMMSTVHTQEKSKKKMVCVKGAPEKVLEHCTHFIKEGKITKLTPAIRKTILEQNIAFSKQALRVLGFAYKEYNSKQELESNLIFVGLQGMIDPPHVEVKDAIARCHQAGIRVIMITGDNHYTAEAIGEKIGIVGNSLEGAAFAALPREEQLKVLETTGIFARVEPTHKMMIVELLQSKGHVVAMTGDGVNDAPAIKKSDLGIAMGITGTDVAKEASDMILQDDNFSSIVNAVEEGRGIYENIRKFVNYLLSCNVGEVFIIFFAILFGWELPMTAIMLLWLNMVTDGLPALALSVDPNPANLMQKPPKKKSEGIMNKSMLFNILFVSVLITSAVLFLFWWAGFQGRELAYAQTVAFTAVIIMELVRLQAIRSEYNLGLFSNKYLVGAIAVSLLLQIAVLYTPLSIFFGTIPLGLMEWVAIIAISVIVYLLNMIVNTMKKQFNWFGGSS